MIANEIFFFGCSYTDSSSGFVDADKMYPALIAKNLNKTEINLALAGHGNYRSFDILGDTEIKNNSVLIFQITELSRIRWYDKNLEDIMLRDTDDKCLTHVYNDMFLIHEIKRNLNLLVKLCRAKDIKLIIWSIARFGNEKLDMFFEKILEMYPEYVFLDNRLDSPDTYRVDNGSDGKGQALGVGHPGPLSHQIIANKLLTKYYQLYNQNY